MSYLLLFLLFSLIIFCVSGDNATNATFTDPATALAYAIVQWGLLCAQNAVWLTEMIMCSFLQIFGATCPPDPFQKITSCFCTYNTTLGEPLAFDSATGTCIPLSDCTAGSFSFY